MQQVLKNRIFQCILLVHTWVVVCAVVLLLACASAFAVTIEFNSTGGTSATDGLRFYIDDSTQIQVRRLNNTGQVYEPNTLPPSTNLDNGIFIRANGLVYGPDHNVAAFTPTGGMYSTRSITATSPPNPASIGDQQTATSNFGITAGPQVTVVWKYTTALDFLTAEVTLVIPAAYPVSAANPVRYYHAFDTFLGGSDNGCGFQFVDSNGKRVVGTYPPSSGTTCPSSTSIPTGVSVVESFRERSGLNFSNYCASGWQSFWVNGSTNCSVLQSANMSNNISTTFQDTGIGIQYNFTSAGTYTFSYDFVVGSPIVPPYDHLEIRHPGISNLCPTNITVLACTSSIVPCPAANIVNTGTLTGSIRQVPGAPSITQTPNSFTLGSAASTATIVFQGTGAGTFTLNGQSLSSTPLNGTRCWNTTTNTASCSYTVTNTACVSNFECIETGQTYNNLTTTPTARNPLFTKLTGAGFRFDVVALQSSGAVASSYTASSGVTVELFDDTTTPALCSGYSSPIASQAITFAAGDNGRKTLASDFTLTNAYRKLRCRVRDSGLNINGCSSDQFSVRPQILSISHNLGTSPYIAGNDFTLTANGGAGYDGAPSLAITRMNRGVNLELLAWTLTNTNNAYVYNTSNNVFTAGNGAATLGLRFHDVGSFNIETNAVQDSTFTAVDGTTDCQSGRTVNTLSDGKYGCVIGSAPLSGIGRFRPNNYTVLSNTLTAGCSAGGFTYMSQDNLSLNTVIAARGANSIVTNTYGGALPSYNTGTLSYTVRNNSTSISASRLQKSGSTWAPASSWINGTLTLSEPTLNYAKSTSPDGPYNNFNINYALTDSLGDNITFSGNTFTNNTIIRYGKLWLPNIYGSELLPLTIPIEAQYWNGSSYVRNQQDTCSVVAVNTIAMGNYRNQLTACETQLSGGGTLLAGKTNATLTKPGVGNSGSVDLTLNLNGASGNTCNSATQTSAGNANMPWFGSNPNVRATFGIFKTPVIYMRENF